MATPVRVIEQEDAKEAAPKADAVKDPIEDPVKDIWEGLGLRHPVAWHLH